MRALYQLQNKVIQVTMLGLDKCQHFKTQSILISDPTTHRQCTVETHSGPRPPPLHHMLSDHLCHYTISRAKHLLKF